VKILIVDDDDISLASLSDVVTMLGHEPVPCPDSTCALEMCRETFFPTIITDIRMPGMDGLDLLKKLKEAPPASESDVIMITGHGDVEMAICALRHGAYDFLRKPLDVRELSAAIDRSAEHQCLRLENRELTSEVDKKIQEATLDLKRDLDGARALLREVVGIGEVVAASPEMQAVIRDARLYHANPDVPVLIEGETGTGKEIVSRLIHFGEGGVHTPFVDINCSAIAENLFESELFGYEAGAFTGSSAKGSRGKMELAQGGTLFLDEIGDLPLSIQPKMLRVLEEHTFYRVGGLKKRRFEARLVCATNRDLKTMVEAGRFRRDLYHRLNIGYIRIPSLRERPEDIPAMARFFLVQEAASKQKRFGDISSEAMDLLLSQEWKGNVRELKNAIERAVLVHDDEVLRAAHLDFLDGAAAPGSAPVRLLDPLRPQDFILPAEGFDMDEFLVRLKQHIVAKAVDRFEQNKTKAAEYLHWDRNKIYRLLGK
jgi:DNA-binding NtrC family response regulator